ncbi:MAG: gliding motility-associated C-terminal domain-containing protein [Cyclobacteriaceae bacterium]
MKFTFNIQAHYILLLFLFLSPLLKGQELYYVVQGIENSTIEKASIASPTSLTEIRSIDNAAGDLQIDAADNKIYKYDETQGGVIRYDLTTGANLDTTNLGTFSVHPGTFGFNDTASFVFAISEGVEFQYNLHGDNGFVKGNGNCFLDDGEDMAFDGQSVYQTHNNYPNYTIRKYSASSFLENNCPESQDNEINDSEGVVFSFDADKINHRLYWVDTTSGNSNYTLKRSVSNESALSEDVSTPYPVNLSAIISTAYPTIGFYTLMDMSLDPAGDRAYFLLNSAGTNHVFSVRLSDGIVDLSEEWSGDFAVSIAVKPAIIDPLLVTSPSDDGSIGTLRGAVNYANGHNGSDTIRFDSAIPDGQTFLLTDQLELTDPEGTVIWGDYDADSLLDFSLVLSGSTVSDTIIYISSSSKKNRIHAFNLQGNLGSNPESRGIVIDGDSNQVTSCYIGTNILGISSSALDACRYGVLVSGDYNTIGDTISTFKNVLSGNERGLYIQGDSNEVVNNYIGVNKDGTAALANTSSGIYVFRGNDNTIGNGQENGVNVISGNDGNGITISGHISGDVYRNKVTGNYIGTTSLANATIPNTDHGISISSSKYHQIGEIGKLPNIIAGNDNGITENGDSSVIENNLIGVLEGSTAVGANNGKGIYVNGSTILIQNNVIANSGEEGIHVTTAQDSIHILSNTIYGNTSTGIELNGANNNINVPVIEKILFDSVAIIDAPFPVNGERMYVYADKADEGEIYLNEAYYDFSQSKWTIDLKEQNIDFSTYTNITAVFDSVGRTSEFSSPFPTSTISSFEPLLVTSNLLHQFEEPSFDSTSSRGYGALSYAIEYANEHSGPDSIRFDPSLTGSIIIIPLPFEGIPTLDSSDTYISGDINNDHVPDITLEGEDGFGGIDQARTSASASCFSTGILSIGEEATNCHINGFIIVSNASESSDGISICGDSNQVTSCVIGTDLVGEGGIGNQIGIKIDGSYNTIGGSDAGNKNTISGNRSSGIHIEEGVFNKVVGNYIGTDTAGNVGIGNNGAGVRLSNAKHTFIGDTVTNIGNVISASQEIEEDGYGIEIREGSDSSYVSNNIIGLSADGNTLLANQRSGVYIYNSSYVTIGGDVACSNYIGSVEHSAIEMNHGSSAPTYYGNKVSHNFIGVTPSGDELSGNRGLSINLTQIDISSNIITNQNEAIVYGIDADSVLLTANAIYDNGDAFIFAEVEGVHPMAIDTPSVSFNPFTNVASGMASANERVQLFADKENQGQLYLGSTTADATGAFTFSVDTSLILSDSLYFITVMSDFESKTSTFSNSAFILTIPNAGSDTAICPNTSITLSANTPKNIEQGEWKEAGTGGSIIFGVEDATSNLPNAIARGFSEDTTYLVWSISHGDDVIRDTLMVVLKDVSIAAVNDTVSGTYELGETIELTLNPSANDIFAIPVTNPVTIITLPTQGSASLDARGDLLYTLTNTEFAGTDSLQYEVINTCEGMSSAWVFITIERVLGASPVANSFTTEFESKDISINLAPYIEKGDAKLNSLRVLTSPSADENAIVKPSLDLLTILVRYPSLGRTEVTFLDSLEYEICDENELCSANWVNYSFSIKKPIVYNAISPNSSVDGFNDFLRIGNADTYLYIRVQVFGRNGEPVFDEEEYGKEGSDGELILWDGKTPNGEILNAGSYLCIVKYGSSKKDTESISTYIVLKSSKQ